METAIEEGIQTKTRPPAWYKGPGKSQEKGASLMTEIKTTTSASTTKAQIDSLAERLRLFDKLTTDIARGRITRDELCIALGLEMGVSWDTILDEYLGLSAPCHELTCNEGGTL